MFSKIKKQVASHLWPERKVVKETDVNKALSEEEFYTKLFIENNTWNKPYPNREEEKRWNIIQKYIYYINGFYYSTNRTSRVNFLDIGCGRGWLTNLASQYGDVLGIEPVKAVVEYARQLYPSIKFETGTTKDLLAANYHDFFDVVICSEVIEHVPDEEKKGFLCEIGSLLNSNGFLILTTPRREAQQEWLQYTRPSQPTEDWLDEFTLERLAISSGFKKHLIERFSISPVSKAPEIEIYQLWLFQKS